MTKISFRRFLAVLHKEYIEIRRDPLTLRMIIALPMMQLFLFGYAINADPKHLPTGLLSVNHSRYERTIMAALANTGYYDVRQLASEAAAERALTQGELLFVVNVPPDFDHAVDRGEKPAILMDADGTDPSTIGNAAAALAAIGTALDRDLPPSLQSVPRSPPFRFIVHARYNPEQLTVLNIVPGLICIVLTFSTLFITTMSITRERERGTMENLLAMPVRPIEVMIAKIVPYIVIGYVQALLIMIIAMLVFGLPVRGSITLLIFALGLFMASNLALGAGGNAPVLSVRTSVLLSTHCADRRTLGLPSEASCAILLGYCAGQLSSTRRSRIRLAVRGTSRMSAGAKRQTCFRSTVNPGSIVRNSASTISNNSHGPRKSAAGSCCAACASTSTGVVIDVAQILESATSPRPWEPSTRAQHHMAFACGYNPPA